MSAIPQQIGRYQIVRILGSGAMGMIYQAVDPEIDRVVAIKLIRADLLDGADRPDFIARFRREAQAAGRCTHPNIVAVHDFSIHDGNPFMVMEFIDGATLVQAWPASRRFSPADAVLLMLQVLAALQAAHTLGVVHRDIKPANIMLTGANLVKVTDFGISRIDTSVLTLVESVVGTPSYMSPEQCRGEAVDARSDIFSAGIVLFEMLAGQKPFTGRNAAEVFSKLLLEPAPDLGGIVADLPTAICQVVARCLAKAPADRFASAADMAAALQAAIAIPVAGDADRTLLLAARPVTVPSPTLVPSGTVAGSPFDVELLDTLTHRLTEFLGPIAAVLVRRAVRKSETVEVLCATLAANIEASDARNRFQQDMQRQIARIASASAIQALAQSGTQFGTAAGSDFSAVELERLRLALASHVGPLARVLIKQAVPTATSLPALWQALAAHIDDSTARAAFLRAAPVTRL